MKNYDCNEWHLEYDHGTWIEDDEDWHFAVIYYKHLNIKYPLELFVISGNETIGQKTEATSKKLSDGKKIDIAPLTDYNISYDEHKGQRLESSDNKLWSNCIKILQKMDNPISVLQLRRSYNESFGELLEVKTLNRMLYDKLRQGMIVQYPPNINQKNKKPLWSLCKSDIKDKSQYLK